MTKRRETGGSGDLRARSGRRAGKPPPGGAAASEKKPVQMRLGGFILTIRRLLAQQPNRKIVWVLGSGASKSSSIPTGGEFVKKWLTYLHENDVDAKGMGFDQWLVKTKAGIDGLDPKDFASSYTKVYDRYFGEHPELGYADLEDAMEDAEPNIGYAILAHILANTHHKMVVTTNFDNLVSDALSLYSRVFPLICGHEALAGFISDSLRRPLIVKVHRDLFLAPKSSGDSTKAMPDGLRRRLAALLTGKVPVVLGYGGNDGSMMEFLASLPRDAFPVGFYWCYRAADGMPSRAIQHVVAHLSGRLVPIHGFDETMVLLANEFGYQPPDESFVEAARKRKNHLENRLKEAMESSAEPEAAQLFGGSNVAEKSADASLAAAESVGVALGKLSKNGSWWSWAARAKAASDPDQREAIYKDALAAMPHSAQLHGLYAVFLKNIRKNFEASQRHYEKALAADPTSAVSLGNYAIFLQVVRRDFAAAEAMYKRAIEADPKHANRLANYAGLLLARGERTEGLPMVREAFARVNFNSQAGIAAECLLYLFAHAPDTDRAGALSSLKKLLANPEARSPGWDFSRNIERAVQDGHPSADWLPVLADVVSAKADASKLAAWEAWQAA